VIKDVCNGMKDCTEKNIDKNKHIPVMNEGVVKSSREKLKAPLEIRFLLGGGRTSIFTHWPLLTH
jgi:hypothetical protein